LHLPPALGHGKTWPDGDKVLPCRVLSRGFEVDAFPSRKLGRDEFR